MLLTVSLLIALVIIAVAAVPLVLRLIPQNPVYGLRTERTMDDEKAWFRVNAFGGKALLVACGVSALLLIVYQGTWLRSGWAQFFTFLLPIVAAVVATVFYERRTSK